MSNNSALLIIDMQKGFINQHTQHLPALIESDLAKYSHVWVTQLEYSPDSPLLHIRKYDGFSSSDEAAKLAITIGGEAKIVTKRGYSAATQSLLEELARCKITEIDLMGVDTDQCVLATALGLLEANIRPRLIIDRCGSAAGPKFHQAGLEVLTRALGEQNVLHSDT